uniref:Putative sigma-70 region domain containing protein n=1 Tax=viral metagenome TaxID=1070528 RepID=A0A6M3IHJ2_9ZZZZ
MTRILIKKNGQKKLLSKIELLKLNSYLIKSLCWKWAPSFSFDRSITNEDLEQELTMKLLSSLDHYDYEIASLTTFIVKVSKNFFINKLLFLKKDNVLVNSINGSSYTIRNGVDIGGTELSIFDLLEAEGLSPEEEMHSTELLSAVRKELTSTTYTPNRFKIKHKTFCRLLFDTLYEPNDKFVKDIIFDFKCRIRAARKLRLKIPTKVALTSESIGNHLNVDKRSVDLGLRLIKKAIHKSSNKLGENNGKKSVKKSKQKKRYPVKRK